MASKKSTKKSSKGKSYYPVVRGAKLNSQVNTAVVRRIDVPAELSKLNRRLYRYARSYDVKIDMRHSAPEGQYVVYALRPDWAMHKGLQMAYQQYVKNTEHERENLGNRQVARWEDYRCDHGLGSHEQAVSLLNTAALAGVRLDSGEFDLSAVVDASNTQRTFTWGTAGAGEYSILEEYGKVANAQREPVTLEAVAPYVDIDSEVNETTHDDLQDRGNLPPYDANGVNHTAPFVQVAVLGATAGAQKLSTGYFEAPCGIVIIQSAVPDYSSELFEFEVKSGNYKGVSSHSLLE